MFFIGEIAALASAILWAFNSIVLLDTTRRLGSVKANITRLVFATTFLLITVLFIKYTIDGSVLNATGYQYYNLIISGVIGLIIGDTFMLMSIDKVGPRISMLMMALTPPISVVLAYSFLNEVLTITALAGIIVTVAGVVLVVLDKEKSNVFEFKPIGIFYGVLAAAGQAVGLIFAKEAFNDTGAELNEFMAALVRLASSTIILIILAQFAGRAKNLLKQLKEDRKALTNSVWAAILGPFLGITGSMIAVAYTEVGIASTLMTTVPIIMLPISKYYYKERLSWRAITGAIIAILGVALLFIN